MIGVRLTLTAVLATFALLAASPVAPLERPNHLLTPGAVGSIEAPTPSISQVCVRGYSRTVRHRYDAEWRRYRTAMFREYGIPHELWSHYTVDHLVPIELGGRPFGFLGNRWELRNVWPEPKAEAAQKDAVENALHATVCYRAGYRGVHLTLEQADAAIARDWTRTPVGLPPP